MPIFTRALPNKIKSKHVNNIFDHYKKTGYLHHAHVISGAPEEVVPFLTDTLREHLGIAVEGNPDLFIQAYETFGIDEARALTEKQARAAWGDARKIFIVSTPVLTREAQNALLKTFEEPTVGTHFFLVVPHLELLLPTLRSRVVLVGGKGGGRGENEEKKIAEEFLDSSLEKRFALAKKIGEMHDREKTRRILDQVERMLYTRLAGKRGTEQIFHDLYQVKTYLGDRGSSPKMLMEQIAIATPSHF